VTLLVGGVAYYLGEGEQKAVPVPAGSVECEMLAGPHRLAGTLQAGKAYTIRIPSR
jgi:hypothetical protein